MNRMTHMAATLTLMLAAGTAPALAGNGAGLADGTGPMSNLYTGTCETLSGTVSEVGYNGSGYVIDTGDDLVSVFGMGPASFWEGLGVAKPGYEDLTVDICWVVYSDGSTKAIATTVTLSDGTVVVLRDPVTGQPLWRGTGNGVQAAAGGGGYVRAQVGGMGR